MSQWQFTFEADNYQEAFDIAVNQVSDDKPDWGCVMLGEPPKNPEGD